jgi:hypothetical protein
MLTTQVKEILTSPVHCGAVYRDLIFYGDNGDPAARAVAVW